MKKHGICSRLISLLLAVALVLPVLTMLPINVSAASTAFYVDDDVTLNYNKKITMPIKIMDYEADGMLFDYLSGNSYMDGPEDYIPESNYWADFTGTLTSGTSTSKGVYYGSGLDGVSLAVTAGTYDSDMDNDTTAEQWLNITKTSLGGKQLMNIQNVKKSATGVPTQWQIADFAGDGVALSKVRYAAIVFRGYNYGLSDPKIGISTRLTDNTANRYADGYFSGWYHLNTTGTINVCGDRNVDIAIIDLSAIDAPSVLNKIYLDFPMNTKPGADGTLQGDQKFNLIAVGFFPYKNDAYEFAYWASSVGAASDVDTYTIKTKNADGTFTETTSDPMPVDSYANNNSAFSLFADTTSSFGNVSQVTEWLYKNYKNGQRAVWLWDTKEYNTGYGRGDSAGSDNMKITDAIGYELFGTFGSVNDAGYAVVGLLESSLDENGLPIYKESVLDYLQTYLRNRYWRVYEYELDGWRNYSAVVGVPNGELYGYAKGGQGEYGEYNIPMDLPTAIATQLGVDRRAADEEYQYEHSWDPEYKRASGKEGSYLETMAKRDYLEGSWHECKQYIETWYDAAYYLLHNLFVANSYNELQNDYNYLELIYDSTSGNYVFDAGFTTNTSYSTAVVYDTNDKTISLSNSKYKGWLSFYGTSNKEALYNPFFPITSKNNARGESANPYYLDDGVMSNNSAYGHNLIYKNHNYGYTMVCNGEFNYKPGLNFTFEGDDDVYLFINGELVMDLGGNHNAASATFEVDDYVTWATTVLKNRTSYSQAEVARAEKLNLKEGETYSFDFFYMERHGTGANLRIETNIEVVVPDLEVNKVASQDGIEIPDNGVVFPADPVEYGFSLTNNGDASKLYNLTFTDSTIGVKLDPTNGLTVSNSRTKDASGGTLTASDLVAYVDGYDGDPNRPSTKKLDTIKVTFKDNNALKNFLKNLTSSGTQSGTSTGLYEGDGLWAYATVTIRGIYYTQSASQQGNDSFTNTVKATATNGTYSLSGSDTHTVFKFGEPAYFQWADHEIVIDSEKLYEDLSNSETYSGTELPQLGHMELTLCDPSGNPMEYPHVSNNPGGDIYLTVNYPTGGIHTFYVNISDKSGAVDSKVIAVVIYTVETKDSAVVLDYGLTADLTSANGIFWENTVEFAGRDTMNTIMGIAAEGSDAEYVEEDTTIYYDETYVELGNTRNDLTTVQGTNAGGVMSEYVGKLESSIYLRHNSPWVIEWKTKASQDSMLMLSNTDTGSTAENRYLFVKNDTTATNEDLIALGYRHATSGYLNYGVSLDDHGLDLSDKHTYALVNKINTDSTNMVYLYVDGVKIAPLNVYWNGGTDQNTTNTWISGQDFEFNYLGAAGHTVDNGNLEYIKVWDGGESLKNFRWETNGTDLVPKAISRNGNDTIALNKYSSTSTSDSDGIYYTFDERIHLVHDKEWAIEFEYSGLDMVGVGNNTTTSNEEVMILASHGTDTSNGLEYLYLRADIGMVAFGRKDSGGYHNYGIGIKELYDADFDTSEKHKYRLENRAEADGKNMVYLIVDDVEIGPMKYYYKAGGYIGTGDFFTGNDFGFLSIGHNSGHWPIDGTLHYLEIWEDTDMGTTYCWNFGSDNTFGDASVSDPNGNRINFTSDADGIIKANDGTFTYKDHGLTFDINDFMDEEYKIMVAATIHDRDFIPTPLENKTVDIANEVQVFKTITVLPATVVYYEDDFPAIKYVGSKGNEFTQIGGGSDSLMQGSDQDTNYGSDSAYDSSLTNMSGDSLYVVKTGESSSTIAYFDFTGTGFEIVGRTNATTSGIFFFEVYKTADLDLDTKGNLQYDEYGLVKLKSGKQAVTFIPVITEYDNYNDMGTEEVHEVPIIRWDGVKNEDGSLAKNEYTVIITGVPSSEGVETYLFLDGIRILNPMGTTNDYYNDNENGATFVEIRNEITNGNIAAADYGDKAVIGAGLTTWTENHTGTGVEKQEFIGQEVSSVSDYLSIGPNNEVYMDGTFTQSALIMLVKETSANVHDLQIGIRAMDYGVFMGAGHLYESVNIQYGVSGEDAFGWKDLVTITTATEQYYTIPYTQCSKIGDYYMVVLRVTAVEEDVPAMAAFSSLKYNGLELGSVSDIAVAGVAEVSGGEVLSIMTTQLQSNTIITDNESEPSEDFETDVMVPENVPAITPKSVSLSFESEVYYNIYFNAENLGAFKTSDMGLAIFDTELADGTIDNAIEVVSGASTDGTVYMVRSNGIAAKNLGDTLYFKIYAKLADGTYVYSDVFAYSGLTYAKNRLAKSTNNNLKTLLVAMLNYGAAAQEYFGYKTDSLMNECLTDEQRAMVTAYDPSMVDELTAPDSVKSGEFVMADGGFTAKNASVSFDGALAINYYFTPANAVDGDVLFYYWTEDAYNNATVLTTANASGCTLMMPTDSGKYWVNVDGIAAKEVNKPIYVVGVYESDGVKYSTGVLTYSVGAYCAARAENGSEAIEPLATATAVYGYYAENYFAN